VAKVNFRQQKRQREMARKDRQTQRLQRRGEQPAPDDKDAVQSPVPPPGGTT
jgi:hypothetical protein